MKRFALILVLSAAFGAAVASYGRLVALLLCVIGVLAFAAYKITSLLERLSRQLTNLYVLTAWKGIPSDNVTSDNPPVNSTKLLRAWERWNRYVFLGSGMSPEDADSAAFNKTEQHRSLIAQHSPDRIKEECNGRDRDASDEEWLKQCPSCVAVYVECKEKLAKAIAAKSTKSWEWPTPMQSCPLPRPRWANQADLETARWDARMVWSRVVQISMFNTLLNDGRRQEER